MFLPIRSSARESLTVSPPRVEFKVVPGQTVTSNIKLENSGDTALDVAIYASSFAVKNENYDQEFDQSNNHLTVNNWFKFDQTNYHLLPKTSQLVNYKIEVPNSAEPGGHYAAVFAQTQADHSNSGDVVEMKRLASLVYIEVAGEISRQGGIESLQVSRWQKSSPIKSQLRLQNSGNTHYRIDGYVGIKNIFGAEVSRSRVNGLLLPSTTRLFGVENEAPSWPGLYKVEANIGFPDGKSQVKSNWIIYLPPLYIYAISLILIVVVAAAVWRAVNSRRKKV